MAQPASTLRQPRGATRSFPATRSMRCPRPSSYSAQLDFDFHRAAVTELLRVAAEVRVFPLLDLARQPSPHVAPLCDHLAGQEIHAEIHAVPYEFQRGGNRMLRLRRWGARHGL